VVRRTVVLLALGLVAGACGTGHRETDADRVTPPKVGACRSLDAGDLEEPSNSSPVVACSARHTAETFLVGTLPKETGSGYRDQRQGRYVYDTCTQAFRDYLGIDESLALRVQLSWAWFRPTELGWGRGARWFRCDVVGGPHGAKRLSALPARSRGMFTAAQPEAWLSCARGATVRSAARVPCSQAHDWRAVATIKLGELQDAYPGDRIVQVRSRDRCSDWVARWSHYPEEYDYGFTWFHEAEWLAGNRRSVCWARTDK
jgi:hypothetical protein